LQLNIEKEDPMSFLHARLLGKFCVVCGEHPLSGLSAKGQELFYYLLFYQDRPHLRETLAELLWNGCAASKSKDYLRKALWQLQSCLDALVDPTREPVLLVDPEWIQINPAADIWTDISVLKQAFRQVQGVPGRNLTAEHAQCLSRAVQLYLGELLEGCYSDWCLREREWCRFMFMACLDKLLDYYAAQHNYEASIAYGERILRYDRARERTHRKMMHLYYLVGDRAEALRQYERCRVALQEELGVGPTQRTELLHQRILSEHPDAVPPSTLVLKDPIAPSRQVYEVLSSLQELQNLLDRVRSQLMRFFQDTDTNSDNSV
jgi:DNA-binding SARP family transcriptional activator